MVGVSSGKRGNVARLVCGMRNNERVHAKPESFGERGVELGELDFELMNDVGLVVGA